MARYGFLPIVFEITSKIMKSFEKFYEEMFSILPVGIWMVDKQGRILQSNPASDRVWNVQGNVKSVAERGKVEGRSRQVPTIESINLAGWGRESSKSFEAGELPLQKAIATGEKTLNQAIEIECLDGERKTVLHSAVPVCNKLGKIAGAIAIFQEISPQPLTEKALSKHARCQNQPLRKPRIAATESDVFYVGDLAELESLAGELEAKQAGSGKELQVAIEELYVAQEELRRQNQELAASRQIALQERQRYQELFDFAPEGYLVTDARGAIQEANRAASVLLGCEQEWLAGKPLLVFACESDRQQLRARLLAIAQPQCQKGDRQEWEMQVQPRQGKRLWVAVSVATARDGAGNILALRWSLRDISDRVAAETALKESEATFRALLEAIPDAMLRLHRDGTILNCLPAAEIDLLSSPHECAGKKAAGVFPSAIADDLMEAVAQALSIRKVQFREFELMAAGAGAENPPCERRQEYEFRIAPISGNEVLAIARNITARKQAERALRQQMQWTELIFQSASDGFWAVSLDGHFLEVNPAFERMAAYSRSELLSMHVRDLAASHLPEEIESHLAASVALGSHRFETQIRSQKGNLLDLEVSVTFNQVGREQFLFAFVRDISDRKKEQADLQLFKTIIEASREAIAVSNPEGQLFYVNPAHEQLFNRSLSEARKLNYRDYCTPQALAILSRAAAPALARGESWQGELEVTDAANRRFPVWARADSILNAEGKIVCAFCLMHDISDRKQAEEELRRSAQILSQIHEAVISTDMQGHITSWNAGAERLYGYSAAAAIGKHISFLYPPESAEFLQPQAIEPLREKGNHQVEMLHRTRSGDSIWVEIFLSQLKDSSGRALGIIGYSIDITHRKKAEAALLQSQHFIQKIAETTPAILYVYDWQQTCNVYVNSQVSELLGYTPDEIQEMKTSLLPNLLHPDDLARLSEFKQQWETAKDSDIFQSEIRMKHRNGEWRYLYCQETLFARHDDGTPRQILGVATDITERKQAEEALSKSELQFRTLADNTPDTIARLDEELRYLYVNPASLEVMGLPPAALMGKNNRELGIPEKQVSYWEKVMRQVFESGAEAVTEYDFPTPGGVRYYQTRVVPEFSETGAVESILGITRDITYRVQLERYLRVAKARLQHLLSASPAVIYSCKVAGEFCTTFMGENIYELVGYEVQEFLQDETFWLTRVHPEDAERANSYLQRVLEQGHYVHEYRFQHKNGSFRWIYDEMQLVYDDAGNPLELVGYWIDITDRKMAEEQLIRLSKAVESASDAISMTDMNARSTYHNQAFLQVFGYTPEELNAVGGPQSLFIDQAVAVTVFDAVMGGDCWSGEVQMQTRSGKVLDILLRAYAMKNEADRPIGVVSIHTDVSARKRSRALLQYRVVLEQLIGDISTHFLNLPPHQVDAGINQALHALGEFLGADRTYVFLFADGGQKMSNTHDWCAPGIDSERALLQDLSVDDFSLTARAIAKGETLKIASLAELPASAVADRDRWQSQSIQSLINVPLSVGGAAVGFIGCDAIRAAKTWTEDDVTLLRIVGEIFVTAMERQRSQEERLQLIASLERRAADLARSNAELEQFAYVASHDLQEPLRMVASYTQLLARRYQGQLDAKADRFIAHAVDGANRMQQLIQDLLKYSRVGTRGKAFARVDSKIAIATALTNLQVAIRESGAAVKLQDDWPAVVGDDTQLVQLFQNLIGNAIKYRGDRPPEIEAGARRQDGAWLFFVRDNGIGIHPQHAERIFMIFQRLHTQQEYPGTGIGLAICQKIVERHGGQIWVESEPDRGSTFYFTIPETGGDRGDG